MWTQDWSGDNTGLDTRVDQAQNCTKHKTEPDTRLDITQDWAWHMTGQIT